MTEPQGGADPKVFTTRAELDGDEWVINGEKWFSSHARFSSFLIVMAITEPDNPPYQQMSMIIVPTDTPGVEIIRNVGLGYQHEGQGTHAYVRYTDVRVPKENLLGDRGGAFVVAQTRLGGGRIHHAMRTVGQVQRAFDMMCERVLAHHAGRAAGSQAARAGDDRRLVDGAGVVPAAGDAHGVADRQVQGLQARAQGHRGGQGDDAPVFHDVAARALQLHGSLGVSDEMPFSAMVIESFHMGLADGPTEVHKVTVARQVLSEYQPTDGLFPARHIPARREEAIARYRDVIERHVVQL